MKTHNLTANTTEWLAYRADQNRHNASEAAAMMGMDPNCKRSELLRAKHVGLSREFSDFMQRRVLDEGHRFEALARPLAEDIIGETLYQFVGSDGWDSASFDGLRWARMSPGSTKVCRMICAESCRPKALAGQKSARACRRSTESRWSRSARCPRQTARCSPRRSGQPRAR